MVVMERGEVIFSVSKVTKQGTQESFEHQGDSIRKLVRDRKTERPQVKRLGLMAKWSLYILPLRVLGTAGQDRPPLQLGDASWMERVKSKFRDDMVDVRDAGAQEWPTDRVGGTDGGRASAA